MPTARTTAACLVALAFAAGVAAQDSDLVVKPPLWRDADDKDISEPAERDVSETFDILRNTWLRNLDLGYLGLKIPDRPALNVNAWDEVPDSSWFTNRIGMKPVTVEELLAGAPGKPPAPGVWRVLQLKTEGYTPGLQFRDAAGERFVLKFDLAQAPERNSAADKIGSLLTHAAGYYTPQNTVVYFRDSDLGLDDEAVFEDLLGRTRPMTRNDLDAALATLARRPDGSIRALASHFLPGIPKGNFPYWGTRKDDPNDIIPHELRRELRGFRVIASWFNHVDVKEVNNLDVYMRRGDGGYLRHYLIDFGSTMGSGDFMNGPLRIGHEYMFDGSTTGKSFVTLGGWERPWDRECEVHYPEVGHFESELFDPERWRPNYPNLAFVEMDASDAYWGAKIVTAFTDDHVRALAEAGQYSRREVTDYVDKVFRERRDAIGRYWLDRVSPLEEFELETSDTAWTLRFRDLAVERGYVAPGDREYRFEVRTGDRRMLAGGSSDTVGVVRLESHRISIEAPPDRWGRTPLFAIDVLSHRRDGTFALPVRVFLGHASESGEVQVLGWSHAPN